MRPRPYRPSSPDRYVRRVPKRSASLSWFALMPLPSSAIRMRGSSAAVSKTTSTRLAPAATLLSTRSATADGRSYPMSRRELVSRAADGATAKAFLPTNPPDLSKLTNASGTAPAVHRGPSCHTGRCRCTGAPEHTPSLPLAVLVTVTARPAQAGGTDSPPLARKQRRHGGWRTPRNGEPSIPAPRAPGCNADPGRGCPPASRPTAHCSHHGTRSDRAQGNRARNTRQRAQPHGTAEERSRH